MVLASRCLDNLWILSIAGNKEVITSWICFSYSGGANVYTALKAVSLSVPYMIVICMREVRAFCYFPEILVIYL
jgi:hypothetical protein